MGQFHVWAAIRTIKSKLGTWAGYDKYLEFDPEITRDQWSKAIGQARAALANSVDEITRPLNRRPVANEITTYESKKARGYLQGIEVYVRDTETGLIETRHYVVKSDTLRSRQFIVNEGIARYQASIDANPGEYPEEILGSAYTSTHLFVAPA